MSDVLTRRATAAAVPRPPVFPLATRTPERAALATAIAKRDKVADYLHRVAAALPAAWDDVAAAEKLAADWEEALRDAKEDEPKRTTAIALGEPVTGLSVADATVSLGLTQAELDRVR